MALSRTLCLLNLLVLSLCSLVSSFERIPHELGGKRHSPYPRRSQIRDELGPQLSSGAVIIDADSGNLTQATQRWQEFASPGFYAVVQVATENDIVATIKYANKYSIPFLAVNTGHGEIKSLAGLQNGIQITIRGMNQITIRDKNATFQGGCNNLEVTNQLWAANKQTVSGTCECVGYLGPLLGGGHGFIQGYHGLAADSLLEARVVLANGSVVVANANSNADLFWALRGAGHNFGIVTEVTSTIYDVPSNDTWFYENYIYTGASVQQLFAQLNTWKRDAPVQFQHYAVYLRDADVDPNNAIVFFFALYNGPAADAQKWVAPFRTFNPLVIQNGTATYPQLSSLTGNGINDDICQNENLNRIRYPIYVDKYNTTVQKSVFDYFNNMTSQHPELAGTLMLFEGLADAGVDAVQLDTTAVALRSYYSLASPVITYAPNPALDDTAQNFGRTIRQMLLAGTGSTELHAYVNYAVGEEPLQALYGYQPWRLQKLQDLKAAYDPKNRFEWYAPVIPGSS